MAHSHAAASLLLLMHRLPAVSLARSRTVQTAEMQQHQWVAWSPPGQHSSCLQHHQ